MFAKDDKTTSTYLPIISLILALGFLIHITLLINLIKEIKENHNHRTNLMKNKKTKSKWMTPFILVVVIIIGILSKNVFTGDFNMLIMVIGFTIAYIGMLIGVNEFIIAAYCIFRFPSFSVNPPPVKKVQYVNRKKKRKKKR